MTAYDSENKICIKCGDGFMGGRASKYCWECKGIMINQQFKETTKKRNAKKKVSETQQDKDIEKVTTKSTKQKGKS
mgnify:CR=1 FL=1